MFETASVKKRQESNNKSYQQIDQEKKPERQTKSCDVIGAKTFIYKTFHRGKANMYKNFLFTQTQKKTAQQSHIH